MTETFVTQIGLGRYVVERSFVINGHRETLEIVCNNPAYAIAELDRWQLLTMERYRPAPAVEKEATA